MTKPQIKQLFKHLTAARDMLEAHLDKLEATDGGEYLNEYANLSHAVSNLKNDVIEAIELHYQNPNEASRN